MRSFLDLSPAKWIWLPAGRTLPCTFALFRKEFWLDEIPDEAKAWVGADSRYLLFINGQRTQWGPAPHDPRHAEADPVDLRPLLHPGPNCIALEVLHYGHPEGTWPFGQPGVIFSCDGLDLHSGEDWKCLLHPGRQPGRPPRWYLRALQEEVDLGREPHGWTLPGWDDSAWLSAKPTGAPSSQSAAAGRHGAYHQDWHITGEEASTLTARSIPLMKEEVLLPASLLATHRLAWHRPPSEWFDFRMEGALTISPEPLDPESLSWQEGEGVALTFAFDKGRCGFPIVEIEASEGTVVEVMTQESLHPSGWLESSFHCWSRFRCREGLNRFEAFDYEALRFLQIHIHEGRGRARLVRAALRSREFDFRHQPEFEVSDPGLQRLLEANVQTLRLSCQDIAVDGMARERQQYSGDCGHQLRFLRLAFGEERLPERHLRTYAQGQLLDGVFADSWPAADRLQRLWQRQMGITTWGAILDHSVGFVLDHWLHYWETGRLEVIQENWPRLKAFARAMEKRLAGGLLDVTQTGDRVVWIDHDAFRRQEEKGLAMNLYLAAMYGRAYAPLADVLGDQEEASWGRSLSASMVEECSRKWLRGSWQNSPDGRVDDRSLAMSLLFDLAPSDSEALAKLAALPEGVGRSYPANVVWNVWALASRGQIQPCLDDMKERWEGLPSVVMNGTIQEMWDLQLGSIHLLSHCAVAPLAVLYDGLLGVTSLAPGFGKALIRPWLGSLDSAEAVAWTPGGSIRVKMTQESLEVESEASGEVVVDLGAEQAIVAPGQSFTAQSGQWQPRREVAGPRTGPFPPVPL